MSRLPELFFLSILVAGTSGCSPDHDDPEPAEALAEASTPARTPEAQPRGDRNESAIRRGEVLEQMRQRRDEVADADTARSRRAQRRERSQRPVDWWNDPDLAERLQLNDSQIEQLGQHRRQLDLLQQRARTELADSQRALSQAWQTGDRDRLVAELDRRDRLQAQLGQAETDRWRAVLELLNDEQLDVLVQARPQGPLDSRRN